MDAKDITQEQMDVINRASVRFFEGMSNGKLGSVKELMDYLHSEVPEWMRTVYDLVGEEGEIPDLSAEVEHDQEDGSARLKFQPNNQAAQQILDLISASSSDNDPIFDLLKNLGSSPPGETESGPNIS